MTKNEPPKTQNPKNHAGEPRAFFGRRSGKRLHRGQESLYREHLPRLEITLGDEKPSPKAWFPDQTRYVLEIGYGGGEHLARQAAENPETGFIGAEVFTGGIAKMVEAVRRDGLKNVRLYTDDALKLLTRLPDASLDGVYLLYPDPWPKLRHHKRRFVSPLTLGELARVLKPGAPLYFATDIEDYANWTLAHILGTPEFVFSPERPGIWLEPYPGWQPTRYEHKARLQGRMVSFYFTFTRR